MLMALWLSISAAGASAWAQNARLPLEPCSGRGKMRRPTRYGVRPAWCEIDTSGPGFGFERFKAYDFLKGRSRADLRRRPVAGSRPCMLQGWPPIAPSVVSSPSAEDRYRPDVVDGSLPPVTPSATHSPPRRTKICPGGRKKPGGDRKRHRRRQHRARQQTRFIRSFVSRRYAIRRNCRNMSATATSAFSPPTSTRSTTRCASPSRSSPR